MNWLKGSNIQHYLRGESIRLDANSAITRGGMDIELLFYFIAKIRARLRNSMMGLEQIYVGTRV